MRFSVSITNRFDAIAASLQGRCDAAARATADATAERWKATTRVDTGEHRDSIHVEEGGDGRYLVVADAPHSVWVEFGTRNQAGDHAGIGALYAQEGPLTERLRQALRGRGD